MKAFRIERSKTRLPCLWETGGAGRNTGESQIIAGENGERLKPLHVATGGHLSNGAHALFVVGPGTIVISASQHRGEFEIMVSRLTGEIGPDPQGYYEGEFAYADLLASFSRSEWDKDPDYGDAVKAAMDKAECYHCRNVFYAL